MSLLNLTHRTNEPYQLFYVRGEIITTGTCIVLFQLCPSAFRRDLSNGYSSTSFVSICYLLVVAFSRSLKFDEAKQCRSVNTITFQ